ncbi:MAG: methyltransferase, TIGR04325 family [Opitutus sp.]
MSGKLRGAIKDVLPPLLYKAAAVAVHRTRGDGLVFSGNYRSWSEVAAKAEGYGEQEILDRTLSAMKEVTAGRAVFERDSVLLPEPEYSFPALTALLWLSSRAKNRLELVDFGGALGSSFFQFRRFLSHLDEIRWAVVEQEHFVRCGQAELSGRGLSFHPSIDDALQGRPAELFFASSVLQYLPDPGAFLDSLMAHRFNYILIDRTAFIRGSQDRLTLQHNARSLYRASYPAWFFNETSFLKKFQSTYDVVYSFDGRDQVLLAGGDPYYRGFLFQRRVSS